MRRALPLLLSALVALAVPAVLLGNGLWLLTNSWYVHAEYARPGFPDDRYGFTKAERTELALAGLRSIQPTNGDGVDVLREARLADGTPAFDAREIAHMSDVRRLVGNVLLANVIGLAVILAAFVVARLRRLESVLSRGLLAGGVLTLAIVAAIGGLMLVNFDSFFVQFHQALFEGDSWRFSSRDTLIRLYPDAFWSDFGGVLAVLTVLQAGLLTGVLWWSRRRTRAPRAIAATPGAG